MLKNRGAILTGLSPMGVVRRIAVDVVREREGERGREVLVRIRSGLQCRVRAVVGELTDKDREALAKPTTWIYKLVTPGEPPKQFGPESEVWVTPGPDHRLELMN